MKTCNTCKISKPISNFNKSKQSKDGYSYYCKECVKEKREKYKNKSNDYQKKYYENNKEKVQERNQKYRKENREKVLSSMRDYYKKNSEEIKEYSKNYYQAKKRLTLDPSYSLEERKREFELTLNTSGGYGKTPYLNRNILTHQPHFYEYEKKLWLDKEVRKYIYSNRKKYIGKDPSELNDREILRAFKISGIHYGFSHFSPFWIKEFIEEYGIKSLYDPCGGWGHRLLGSWDIEYIYNDIDKRTVDGVKKIYEEHRNEKTKKKVFFNKDASEFSPKEEYEAVFTCPPYFNLEEYSDEETSTKKYSSYESWINVWWKGVIENCNPKKYFAFVINEDLKEDMRKIVETKFIFEKEVLLGKKRSHYTTGKKEVLLVFKSKRHI